MGEYYAGTNEDGENKMYLKLLSSVFTWAEHRKS
jgi:hypothetical protein